MRNGSKIVIVLAIAWLSNNGDAVIANSGGDADADGLPDPWELAFFGDLSSDPDDNPDNDLFSNVEEFELGTSPIDPNDPLTVATVDSFAPAFVISGEGNKLANTVGATGEANEPQHGGNATTASIWLRYEATQAGSVTISTAGSQFDTILAIYSGSSLTNLQLLALSDDFGGEVSSETQFDVEAGEAYSIAIDGKNGAGGLAYIAWNFEELPPSTLESWAAAFGLSGKSLLASADDDNDQISLLEEYAFNLDPTASDNHYVTPGSGTSGLPLIRLIDDRLQIEYLRRKLDGNLATTPQFGSSLPAGFVAATETEIVTPINGQFERVVINDSQTTSTALTRFGRVYLEYSQP